MGLSILTFVYSILNLSGNSDSTRILQSFLLQLLLIMHVNLVEFSFIKGNTGKY